MVDDVNKLKLKTMMKNQEIKGSLNLDPHFISKWVFIAIFDVFLVNYI